MFVMAISSRFNTNENSCSKQRLRSKTRFEIEAEVTREWPTGNEFQSTNGIQLNR